MIKINYIPTFVGDYNLVGEKMSEICLECYNEIMGTNIRYLVSKFTRICASHDPISALTEMRGKSLPCLKGGG